MNLTRLTSAVSIALVIAAFSACDDGRTYDGAFGARYGAAPKSKSQFGPQYNNGPSSGTSDQVLDAFCQYAIKCAPQIDDRRRSDVSSSALQQCRSLISGQGIDQIDSGILLAALTCLTQIPCSLLSNPEGALAAAYPCLRAAGLTNLPSPPTTTPQPRRDQGADKFVLPDFSFPQRDSTVDAGASDADLGV